MIPRSMPAEVRQFLTGNRAFRAPAEIREFETRGDELIVVGHGAVFDARSQVLYDWFVEELDRGAFRKVLRSKPDVRFWYNHGAGGGMVLARTKSGTLEIAEDTTGVAYEANMSGDIQAARDLYAACERGDVDQSSFMFSVADGGQIWEYDSVDIDGETYHLRRITEIGGLHDMSAVAFPAYLEADAGTRAAELAIPESVASSLRPRSTEPEAQERDGGSRQQPVDNGDSADDRRTQGGVSARAAARQRELELRNRRFRSTHP